VGFVASGFGNEILSKAAPKFWEEGAARLLLPFLFYPLFFIFQFLKRFFLY
jgi:hypothetical protein